MAAHVRLGRLGDGDAGGASTTAGAVRDLPDRLWTLLTSMRFGLLLILVIAALSLVGTLLVQAPPGVLADPDAKRDWLNQVRPKYGGWTGILDSLQFFTMFQSVWYKGLVGLLTASLLACTAHRVPGVLRTVNKPHVAVGERFFEHAPQHERMAVQGDVAKITGAAQTVLRKHGFRTRVEDDGAVHIYGDKWWISQWAGLVGHLALVVIFAGVLVGSTWGFRDSNFTIAEGSTATVPTADGLSVKLVSFEDAWYSDTGAPSDYASDLILYRNGAQIARQTIRVNDPLRYGSLSFYQSFYGPAIAMTVTDKSGKAIYQDGVPLAWETQDGTRRIGSLSVPGSDVTVWIVGTAGLNDSLIRPGQVRLELYNATTGNALDQRTIDQGKPTTIGDLTFTFGREIQYTGLSVASDPGAPLVWLGSFLLIAGFTIRLFLPFRRVWGRLEMRSDGRGVLALAAPGTHDIGSDRAFTELVIDMRQACAPSPAA